MNHLPTYTQVNFKCALVGVTIFSLFFVLPSQLSRYFLNLLVRVCACMSVASLDQAKH